MSKREESGGGTLVGIDGRNVSQAPPVARRIRKCRGSAVNGVDLLSSQSFFPCRIKNIIVFGQCRPNLNISSTKGKAIILQRPGRQDFQRL